MSSIRDAKEAVDEISPKNVKTLRDVEDVQVVIDYITSELKNLKPFTNDYIFQGAISLTQILEFYCEDIEKEDINNVQLDTQVISESKKLYDLINSIEYNYPAISHEIFEEISDVLQEIHRELDNFLDNLEKANHGHW